jgi:hypothetical protein
VVRAAALVVFTSSPMAGFTTDIRGMWSFGFKTGVGGGFKVSADIGMALSATLRTGESGTLNLCG